MQSASADAAPQDRDILELLHKGAYDQAFAQLLDRYEHKLFRLCCALLRDATLAQDAAQESLVRVWKALPSYDGRASLSTWIYAITRNRCLTALARRREESSLLEPEAEADMVSVEDAEPNNQSMLLRALVEQLPERYRRVLTLYYYEDCSVNEVAAALAMPEGTVKTTLHRARAALMEQLRRRGLDVLSTWLEIRT
jgi:RNA polymerase sigma-70 factor (ECF subfamily)